MSGQRDGGMPRRIYQWAGDRSGALSARLLSAAWSGELVT